VDRLRALAEGNHWYITSVIFRLVHEVR
jgi:hypothetical protein